MIGFEMDNKLFRQDNKLFIQYEHKDSSGIQSQGIKEIDLGMEDYYDQPESVEVSMGLTLTPKPFESVRFDYKCSIHHRPGQDHRDHAFDLARANCISRIKQDILELKVTGTIQDHYLLDKDGEK
jgi:hypothetical protein